MATSPDDLPADFRLLFESLPGLYLVLKPDFTIAAVTEAYLSATLTERDRILGKHIFDVFPDNPADPQARATANLRASLQRVLDHARPDRMSVQKYDVRRPEKAGGGFEERYWSPLNSPVLNPDGSVRYILHEVQDVTQIVQLRQSETEYRTFIQQLEREIAERRRAEAEVKVLERRCQSLFDNSMDAVLLTSPDGRVWMANRAAQETFGYSAKEFQELGRHALADPGDPQVQAALRQRQETGSFRGELTFRRKDGTRLPVEVSSAIFVDEHGAQWTSMFIRDVTSRNKAQAERELALKALDEQKRWLEAVFERAPLGMVMVRVDDPEHMIPNEHARRIFGPSIDWKLGRTAYLGQACDADGRPLSKDRLTSSRILRGETIMGEEQLLRFSDGRTFPIVVAGGPIDDEKGERIGAVAFFQDISPLKELERLREEWAAVIAHDLRQPIGTIQLQAFMLKSLPKIGDKARRAAELIESSARHLAKMTEDLLEVSRLEAKELKLELKQTDPVKLVRDVIEKLKPLFPRNPILLDVEGGLQEVQVDPERLEQVLGNLISNASKYGYPQTEITLHLRQDGPRLEVSVTNRGPGISTKDLDKLFQRFHRTRLARSEGIKGIGLGLYITKGLVEAHGGRIQVDSIPGETTTFTVELPVTSAEAESL